MGAKKKSAIFVGSTQKDLRAMPAEVRQEMGKAITRLEFGGDVADARIMRNVGPGTYEIRVRNRDGIYRAFYVARFTEAIYVLHAFQKKTEKTAPADIERGRQRYQAMLLLRRQKGF